MYRRSDDGPLRLSSPSAQAVLFHKLVERDIVPAAVCLLGLLVQGKRVEKAAVFDQYL